ncbi:MAG: DUF222 domain-containing protein [Micromonosporaceae bacterium]|nr:DUF222 domain-containing protein [Micromonosporaceae bacterium]
MSERQVLPEDLELVAPGPELAVLLASVDRRRLSDQDRIRLVQARNRLVSHQQAQLLADVYAVSVDEPPEDEPGQASRFPWAEVELAFALRWTRMAAGGRLEQARQLVEDLPAVQAALSAGEIDMPKALVIAELAGWLDDPETARRVVDRVIDQAPQLTTGQLRARLRRLVLAIDPDAARRRCAAAVKTRRVESFDNPDGTGELWGRSLPPQDSAAVWERLTAIARSAKTAGDPRSVDQLRADALLDLLVGEGVAVGGPLTRHTADLPGADEPPEHEQKPPATGETPAGPGWDPQWPSQPPDQLGPHDVHPGPVDEPVDRWDEAGRAFDRGDPWPVDWPGPRLTDPAGTTAHPAPPPRRGVVDLQVPLVTLLRLAELPGELGGWGPVIADIARQIVAKQTDGTWRFSVYDQLGELAFHGITRKRPTAGIAAFVRARDHTCVAPGCRRPAVTCDLDHTVDKQLGGHSGPSNLGSLCRLHHRFKHTGGADLIQLSPGVFGWTTPRGMQYVTKPHRPLLAACQDRPASR